MTTPTGTPIDPCGHRTAMAEGESWPFRGRSRDLWRLKASKLEGLEMELIRRGSTLFVHKIPSPDGIYDSDMDSTKCYIVATCDRDLKRRIRKVPGVPIMYITKHQYSIERLPEATVGGAPRF